MSDSESELTPQEALTKRHRKEKKDLQGKIQALKKTASKGDKKKKKEVTEEIAKLEHELDQRHQQEIEQLSKSDKVITEVPTPKEEAKDEQKPQERISKAQKRRDKKAQKEKDRQAEIEKQEEENVSGSRNVENLRIDEILTTLSLKVHHIPSDGDCLYAGVAHQLDIKRGQCISVVELRKLAADFISENSDDFLPFMSNPNSGDMLTPSEFDKYLDDLKNTKVWGGQIELRALSQCLKCCIEVIQAEGPPTLIGNEFEDSCKLILTYHRHMYFLGEHYNSTQCVE